MVKEWSTQYPLGLDSDGYMPELINLTDLARASQILSLRDAVIQIETAVGSDLEETGSLRKRTTNLETSDSHSIHDNLPQEIHQILNKPIPVSADEIIIEDSEDSWVKKRVALSTLLYNTLDQAYDQGGSGVGRIITIDSGPIELNGSGNAIIVADGYVALKNVYDPVEIVDSGIIYVNGSELVYLDEYGNYTQLTADGYVGGHAEIHISGGNDEIDGDKIDIDWNPSNYSPSTSPSEVDSVDELTAHLAGIDAYLSNLGGGIASGDGYLTDHINDTDNPHATNIGNIGIGTLSELNSAITDAKLVDATLLDSYSNVDHDSTHISGGSDEIDGDKIDIDWNPSNYSPSTSPSEVDSVDELTAHLAGIDAYLGSTGNTIEGHISETNPHSTTFIDLGDTPANYSGFGGLFVRVNGTETGVEFVSGGGSGLVDGYLPMEELVSDPSPLDNYGMLYTKDDSGDTELFYLDNSGNAVQITQDGYVNGSGGSATSPLTTKGDIWAYDTDDARLPVGADGYVLTADSAEALGVKWAAAAGGTAAGAAVWSYLSPDVLPTGAAAPEAVWQFDGTVDSFDDRTANGHDLSVTGGTAWYTSLEGLVGLWSNSTFRLEDTTSPAGLRTTGAFTAEFLVSLERDPVVHVMMGCYGADETEAENTNYSLTVRSDGHVRAEHEYSTGSDDVSDFNAAPSFGSLTYVAITRSTDGFTYKVYMDGQLVDTQTANNAPTGGGNAIPKLLGSTINYFTGAMFCVRFTKEEWTADQVAESYNLTYNSAGGGGFTAYEEEFTASSGANEFTLSATPAINTNTLSGRNILGVFRNGVRSRYQATATLSNEYSQSGGVNKINVVGQSGGELFTIIFGV